MNYTIGFLESSNCKEQIMGLLTTMASCQPSPHNMSLLYSIGCVSLRHPDKYTSLSIPNSTEKIAE